MRVLDWRWGGSPVGRLGLDIYANQLAVSEDIPLGSRPWALYVLKQWCQLNNVVL